MSDRVKHSTLLLLILDIGASRLNAGSAYQTVLSDPDRRTVLIVDMDGATHMDVPLVDDFEPALIAVDSEGVIHALAEIFCCLPGFSQGSGIARLDPTISHWTATVLDSDVVVPNDMEFKPDGNLVVGGEIGIYDIDLSAKTVQIRNPDPRTGIFDRSGGTIAVEIDPSETFITGAFDVAQPITTLLFRQTADAQFAERFDSGVNLADFVLDSDGSLIGAASRDGSFNQLDTGTLYRLNFDTKSVKSLFESEVLRGVIDIELDPARRIVALTRPIGLSPRLVRVDLELGTSELIAEFDGYRLTDMDLRFIPEPVHLQPGDANQDFKFDQLDVVQVQIAAKYLTGEAASWGEGDWDGAPGGSAGDPPPGDGLFNQQDIMAALQSGVYLTGPYAAVQPNGQARDSQTSIVYNARSGELAANAPAGTEFTSINVDSASGIFIGIPAANLGGSFDNDTDDNIFKATFGDSCGSLSFGNVAQAGLSEEFVVSDLTVVGSLAGGGDLGEVDLVYVPEPTSTVLLAIGLLTAISHFRLSGR